MEVFIKNLNFFKSIAEKELANQVISDDDYETLRTTIRRDFPDIVWVGMGEQMTEKDARAGIIADIHTDGKTGQVLYEATGIPSIIYVAVKDKGGTRLTRGVVYSYYEFAGPLQNRYSDDEWQGTLYDGKNTMTIPSKPDWSAGLTK
jgi:hypothetical protein